MISIWTRWARMGGLPITDFTVGACDEFSPRPQLWITEVVDGIHYQIADICHTVDWLSGHASVTLSLQWPQQTSPLESWARRRPRCCAISGNVRYSTDSFLWLWLELQCEAPKIAKLAYNSNNYGLWMFMVLITIVTGAYKPTYNWGASHCSIGYAMRPLGLVVTTFALWTL